MRKLLWANEVKTPRTYFVLTIGFALGCALGVSMALPKSVCAADACQTVSKIVNGEYRVCKVCCTDAGACQEFCH